MLIIFPITYLLAFLFSFKEVINGRKQGLLLFVIFGLSIYSVTLSILFVLGLQDLIVFFQPLKEILILSVLAVLIWDFRQPFIMHPMDYAVLIFFTLTCFYVFLPLGGFSFGERVSALKSMSFFAFVYSAGRLFNLKDFYLSKNFKYALLITIAAAIVTLGEGLFGQHFQTISGYAEYNFYMYDQEPSGNYGLTWTFEASGFKRFASFFSNPLEHASATLLALALIAGLYTNDKNEIKLDMFGKIALAASQISIFFALSRASLVSYFFIIYVYAFVTKKKSILNIYYYGFVVVVLYFMYFLQNEDVYDYVVDTITFEHGSSIGHVIEWLAGIESMIASPFGLGLGSSGKVSNALGLNVGGENQFIIIGVQVGVIGFLIYLTLQVMLIAFPLKWINRLSGKERKLAITVFLLKVGSIIPLMTSDFESYTYISYFIWFLSGLFINVLSQKMVVAEKNNALME